MKGWVEQFMMTPAEKRLQQVIQNAQDGQAADYTAALARRLRVVEDQLLGVKLRLQNIELLLMDTERNPHLS